MQVIHEREICRNEILSLSEKDLDVGQIEYVSKLLTKLRLLSIRTVELIVLWRD
jgi:hypothetical protein